MPFSTKTSLVSAACLLTSSCILVEPQPGSQQEPETAEVEKNVIVPTTTVGTSTPEPEPIIKPEPHTETKADSESEEALPTSDTELKQPSEKTETRPVEPKDDELVLSLCEEIGNKLGSVDSDDCLSQNLLHSGLSIEGRSLAYRDFDPVKERQALGRVLVIGGIHGDEFSSVSLVFKWMNILQEHHSGLFHWRFIPSSNPDGLLQKKSQRQNIAGVDLNRNFPTKDWDELALSYWKEKAYSNARRYPGTHANSEPETQWLVEQIDAFKPDIIVSMHAPYHLVDYDGPPSAPEKLGGLYLRQLGVYPGSLGNYIGVDKQKPIVTVELKSAGIMPSEHEIDRMWADLIRWLRSQLG